MTIIFKAEISIALIFKTLFCERAVITRILCKYIEVICWIRWNIDFNSQVITENDILTSGAAVPENIIPLWAPRNVFTCMFK